MDFEIVPAYQFSVGELAEAFTSAFTGYLAGSVALTADTCAHVMSAQAIDLCHSRVVSEGNQILGFGFINWTGEISRVAGMGVVPSARRHGVGKQLLCHLINEARKRGDYTMILEVFEQNSAALPLYQAHGFRPVTRLFAWRRTSDSPIASKGENGLREIRLLEAASMLTPVDYPDWPWQISRQAILKMVDARAFQLGNSCVVVSNPALPPIRIQGLLAREWSEKTWEELRQTLSALVSQFSGCEFFAREIIPESCGDELFRPLGFERGPLNQFLMRLDL